MVQNLDDTIAALASAPGGSFRSVIRVSGLELRSSLEACFEPATGDFWNQPPLPRRTAGWMNLSEFGPCPAQLQYWPTARSYTGQPMAEIHSAGSPVLQEQILSELFQHGVRPAGAGEFTLRAFLAGRLDLIQAEAVLGVIDAEDHVELQLALAQLAGGLSGRIGEIRESLLHLLAELEAGLDFVEEDIEFVTQAEILSRLTTCRTALETLKQQAQDRTLSRSVPRVVLAGFPNAGKSTLFNHLAGSDLALVSAQEGTTRDYLSAIVTPSGMTLELIDTAGWEQVTSDMLQQADSLRRQQMSAADLILWCTGQDWPPDKQQQSEELLQALVQEIRTPVLTVQTRADLKPRTSPTEGIAISTRSGEGLHELTHAIRERLSSQERGSRQFLGTSAARCRESLESAMHSLQRALEAASFNLGDELTALEIRGALQDLGRILGAVYTDDILDRIFSQFCIGK